MRVDLMLLVEAVEKVSIHEIESELETNQSKIKNQESRTQE